MAGSWRHMTTSSGRLRDNRSFNGMIENGGDAYEAASQCYGMVWVLARALAERLHGTDDPSRTQIQDLIAQAEDRWKEGLKDGKVQGVSG